MKAPSYFGIWQMLISFSFLFVAEDKNYFCNREFSFTLKDDVYLRYKSFANEKELKEEILRLNPYKIDIGAVYTTKVPTQPSTLVALLHDSFRDAESLLCVFC